MKMKYIALGLMAFVVMTAFATAASFNNKQDAFDYFDTVKAAREDAISKAVVSATFTTDKECEIDYKTELPKCHVCVVFQLNGKDEETCIPLEEGTTLKDDQDFITMYVTETVKARYPIEKVDYKERDMKDTTLSVKPNLNDLEP